MSSQVFSIRLNITSLQNGKTLYNNFCETKDPMQIVLDKGYLFPELEKKINTLAVGESDSMYLMAHEAFGENDEKAIKRISIENITDTIVHIGQKVSLELLDGKMLPGTVIAVDDDDALIDFNHPLAGEDIKVDVVLENVVQFE